jgi:hypothetical protein
MTIPPGGAVDAPITITFSEPMEPSSFTTNTFTVKNLNGSATGSVSYNPDTRTASFTPSPPLEYSMPYFVTLTTGVKNLAQRPLQVNAPFKYETPMPPGYYQIFKETFSLQPPYDYAGQFNVFTMDYYSSWYAMYNQRTLPEYGGGYQEPTMHGGYAYGSENYSPGYIRTSSYNLSAFSKVELRFMSDLTTSSVPIADVDVSTTGVNGPWINVWRKSSSARGNEFVDISSISAHKLNLMVRFRFYGGGASTNRWKVDEVSLIAKP